MASNGAEKEVLQLAIDELRRLYDAVTAGFESLRTKALALLGGEVALLTLVFALNPSKLFNGKTPVSIIVFLGIGLFLLSLAFLILLSIISTTDWRHPPDEKAIRSLEARYGADSVKFLRDLKDEYIDNLAFCIGILTSRARRFTYAIYALSIGVLIVLVIKFGGGIVKL